MAAPGTPLASDQEERRGGSRTSRRRPRFSASTMSTANTRRLALQMTGKGRPGPRPAGNSRRRLTTAIASSKLR